MDRARWAVGLAVMLSVGCGHIRSQSIIVEASAELDAAEIARASKYAPYELMAATSYLKKAREEQSYADFEAATILGERARDCAHLARKIAERTARLEMGASASKVPRSVFCRPGILAVKKGEKPPANIGEPDDPTPTRSRKKKRTKKKKKRRSEPEDPSERPAPIAPDEDEALPAGDPLPDGDDELPDGDADDEASK